MTRDQDRRLVKNKFVVIIALRKQWLISRTGQPGRRYVGITLQALRGTPHAPDTAVTN